MSAAARVISMDHHDGGCAGLAEVKRDVRELRAETHQLDVRLVRVEVRNAIISAVGAAVGGGLITILVEVAKRAH